MNYFKSEDRLTDLYGDAGKQLIVNGINVREGSGQPVYRTVHLKLRRILQLTRGHLGFIPDPFSFSKRLTC